MIDRPRHSDGRPAAFRHFDLTIRVSVMHDRPLPETFREWLELAVGVDLADGPAVPTTLERIVETRYPLAVDVIERRATQGRARGGGPW